MEKSSKSPCVLRDILKLLERLQRLLLLHANSSSPAYHESKQEVYFYCIEVLKIPN